jgi:hypothetical protein
MKLISIYVFTTLLSHVRPSVISTKKICKDCIHFIGDNRECRKFGDTNIITGKVTYNSARSVREDKNKCGEDAILFEKNNLKIITVPYYFFKDNSHFMLPTGVLSLYFFVLINILHK